MFKKIRKYLPIKIHNIYYGYGWWFSDKFVFLKGI